MIGLRASLSRPGHIRGKALEATSVTIMGQELAIPEGEFDVEYRGPRITTLENAFYDNKSITELELDLDTKECLSALALFASCIKLVSLDISKLDLSNCTTFITAFRGLNLNSISGLENLNYPKNSSISWMLAECSKLKPIDTRKWNKTKNVAAVFYGCRGLESCPDLNFIDWDNLTDASYLFTLNKYGGVLDLDRYVNAECKPVSVVEFFNHTNFEQINISKFNFANVASGCSGVYGAFCNVPKLKRIKGGLRNLKIPLEIRACSLTHDALIELFDSLYDLAAAGMASESITLPDAQKALLSDEEIAALTTKGWTLA